MAKSKLEINKKRLAYVNEQFGNKTRGLHINNSKKSKFLKKLWREAKRTIK